MKHKEPSYEYGPGGEEEPSMVREPIHAYGRKTVSIAEYLEWESTQLEKHESTRRRSSRCAVLNCRM